MLLYERLFKRLLDITCSIIALPVLLIVLIPVAILIKLNDNGPVFYNSIRLGKNKVPFKMFKFRTMKVNAPDIRLPDGSTYNSQNDSRVTGIGKVIRELSIDELPQIINVLIGNMSLVGPRPDVPNSDVFEPEFDIVFTVKPGITGYNQAYYRNESSRIEKLIQDKKYVESLSFWMDLKIIFNTVLIIFKKGGVYKS